MRRVYTAGPLLGADTAMLTRLVPVGCMLLGARTGYDRVQVVQSGVARVVVTAVVAVAASTLSCPGRLPVAGAPDVDANHSRGCR